MKEADLRPVVTQFLEQRGMEVHAEVPLNGRIADLVGLGDGLTAVELKLADWRRGLRQAICYQIACEESYLCFPFPRALRLLSKSHYLEREGIGLLGCLLDQNEVRVLFPASPSPRWLPFMGEGVRRRLRRLGSPVA
ncbi:MAG: hypothetical protein ACE5I4_04295 [Thermoplasmata archaeon]